LTGLQKLEPLPLGEAWRPAVSKSQSPTNILSVSELATELRVCRASAYALADHIGIRLGRRILVPRPRLEAWLNGTLKIGARRRRAA
jgi:hypothetical protein